MRTLKDGVSKQVVPLLVTQVKQHPGRSHVKLLDTVLTYLSTSKLKLIGV